MYRKANGKFNFTYREPNGRQRWETRNTYDEAKEAKKALQTDIARGEFKGRGRVTLHEYAKAWVERYHGRGRHGFRENTRDEYRRLLDQYALTFFHERTKLTGIAPSDVAESSPGSPSLPCGSSSATTSIEPPG